MQTPDQSPALYAALRSRDRRWDGKFFVGVRTTRIYCRPVCRARMPHAANCTFYGTAAAAERDGYRPCLRCRPELAPGQSLTDATGRLARAAFQRIAAGALNGRTIAQLASDLHVGERQLRRVVQAEFGVSPVELAQTQRLLFAKQLLTDTSLPVTRIAFASGFGSVSRFNTLFLKRYRMSPTRLRRNAGPAPGTGDVTLLLHYRPPYAWESMLAFLRKRLIAHVERCDATSYSRALRVSDSAGWIRVTHDPRQPAIRVQVSAGLVSAIMDVQARVRRMFDLDADPAAVDGRLASDPLLAGQVRREPGLRLPGAADGFELAVRGILGQQVTVAAAHTLCGRVTARYAAPLDDPGAPAGLTRLPLEPAELAAADVEEVSALGMPRSRARTLVALAAAVDAGDIRLDGSVDAPTVVASLRRIPGIGPWTAEYVMMRGLGWPDAFPASDLGVRNALGGVSAIEAARIAEAWRPWRSYAVIHLWNSLARSD